MGLAAPNVGVISTYRLEEVTLASVPSLETLREPRTNSEDSDAPRIRVLRFSPAVGLSQGAARAKIFPMVRYERLSDWLAIAVPYKSVIADRRPRVVGSSRASQSFEFVKNRHQPKVRRSTLSTPPLLRSLYRMRILLAPLLFSYIRTVLGVPFVKDAIRTVVSAARPKAPPPDSADFWFHIVISIFLVLAGGVFAG
jgi:hypothetical protein